MKLSYSCGIYVGAYASCEESWWGKVLDLPYVEGLEIPASYIEMSRNKSSSSNSTIKKIITCIPETMKRMGENPHFGLASTSHSGRKEAISFMRDLHQKVGNPSQASAISAIHIHSAPRGGHLFADADCFYRSLCEILGWDWCGIPLVVEHCDAWMPAYTKGWPVQKGFLSLHDELDVLSMLDRGTGTTGTGRVGVAINWARSAIEERSSLAPIKHLKMAQEKKMLRGLFFSGVNVGMSGISGMSEEEDWKDNHAPLDEEYSLLTMDEVKKCLEIVESNVYIGIKFCYRSHSNDQIFSNRHKIESLRESLSHLGN